MFERSSDEELMTLYVTGEKKAFDELFRRYKPRVYGYLSKYLSDARVVDDLFQTVFLKLHRSRAQYEPGRLFSAWVFTICRNVVRDHLRHVQRLPRLESEDAVNKIASSEDKKTEWEGKTLDELLIHVPEKQREALRMRYQDDLEFDAIARKLNTTADNARQIISRALRGLKKRVSK